MISGEAGERARRIACAERAATFFQQAALARLLELLRQKYVEQGQVGGQVVLTASTQVERRELASFLARPPSYTDNIKVRLRDIDTALQNSGFSCTLPEMLVAAFPAQELITRPQQRAARADQQAQFYQQLLAIQHALSDTTRGASWLQQGSHGLPWLFARYKNSPSDEQQQQLKLIKSITEAINQLPTPDQPMRLAIFAQSISGNPHYLDAPQPAGRLFLLALSDLYGQNMTAGLQGREQELQLYQEANLLVDTISSSVAVFNLASATYPAGTTDQLISAAGARTLLLPLSQLTQWQTCRAAQPTIFVLENPQVFEELVASLLAEQASRQNSTHWPTIICTAGWPSFAAIKLIKMLVTNTDSAHIYYNGDFDLKGLQIASYLLELHPQRSQLWQMDIQAYTSALQAGGIQASASDLQKLGHFSGTFAPLSAHIQATGTWAYQEGITTLLINDIRTRY
ncbi:TIGR02679 family protein [Dictyobacter arantiisoli]|uniref:TIGR02679 family protein n=1 Tax=Dictyobacter arantiisoli TaxID=2014874 RepID=A0A5A5TF79_9CHLR|nr:TIGR02679 family protein [Dictyobacter arantiisoli]GCF09564.1 hypothetical protein KDI_31280 [Dictyobacter arantiisoli]